jgi:hypothetical protein
MGCMSLWLPSWLLSHITGFVVPSLDHPPVGKKYELWKAVYAYIYSFQMIVFSLLASLNSLHSSNFRNFSYVRISLVLQHGAAN